MKTLLSLFCICALFSCTAQTNEKLIGIDKSGVYELTASTAELKTIFDTSLRKEGITAGLVNFEIKRDVTEGSSETYYYLISSNSDGSVKIVTDLTLKSDHAFVVRMAKDLSTAFASTCTCSGSCTKGCDPRHWKDAEGLIAWRCSSCTQKGKTCNKSVTDSN